MADTIDSLSIELTADTSAAEGSIDRLILKLERLKSAVSGASNFSKVAQGIARIAAVASGIDNDAGKKLAKLAAGVTALSKVGDLSNLKDAGKNLASVVKAVNGLGASGAGGLGGLASAIKDTGDALGGIRESDVSKLGAIRDALSGEMSGPLHTSGRVSESAALGGMGTPEPRFGNMAAYGAMTVFKYTADSIRDASNAYQEFRKALGAGVPTVFTEFVDGAKEAKRVVIELGSAIRGLLTEGQNFSAGTGSDTFWGMKRTPLLNAGQNFTFGATGGLDKSNAIEIEDLGERIAEANEAANAYSNLHDRFVALREEMIKTNSFMNGTRDAMNGKLPGVALSLSDFKGFAGLNAATNSLREFLSAAIKLPTVTVSLKDFAKTLGGITGAGVKAALYDLPKFFGGKLLDSIRQAAKGMTGLFNSFVRIAKYRAIRTALRLITQGISEGVKNLYAWSAATNGEFKASMDMIATASQYLGNSFAAMVSPLIQRLAPAIDFIVDKFVDMFNVVNQIFARLTGQTSYTAAKKIKSQWKDASESASGAAKKAAKEIRATLLGFDEINRLNAATDSTGGIGGGAGSGISAEDMFEQRPISSWIQEMVDGSDFTKLGSTVAQKINEALGGIDWTSIKKRAKGVAESVVSAINGFIGEIDPRTVGQSIAGIINTGMTLIDTFWSKTDWAQAGQKLRTALVTLFEDIDVELAADALTGKFRSLVMLIYNAIPKSETEWTIIGTKISTFINRSISRIPWATIGNLVGDLLIGAIRTMTILADNMTLTHIAQGVKNAIQNACRKITPEQVQSWVGAVLKDVLSAIGVLFNIQLKIGNVTLSPLAILTFTVLAKTLLGHMIGNVFGATSSVSLGSGLAWSAVIGLAVSAGVQMMGVVDDLKNGKPIDPQKVADIVWTAFSSVGFMMLAKGNPLGAAFMIGLGFAVKPLVKGILEIFFPADGEVKATKDGVIDILKGAFRTAGVGLVYGGVKTGNLAMAGAGAVVFGFSFMIEPIVNDVLDLANEIKSGSISLNSICKVIGDALIAIGSALLFVNPVAGAIVLGIGFTLKLVAEDIEFGLGKIKETMDDLGGSVSKAFEGLSKPGGVTGFFNKVWGALTGKGNNLSIDIKANVDAATINGKSYTGQSGTTLWGMMFPGANAETMVNVKANQYSQEWYNANIAPLEAGAKANPIQVPVNLVKSAASTIGSLLSSLFGGKKEKEQKIDVKTNLVKGDLSLLDEIQGTPLDVKIKLKKQDWTTVDRFADLERVHDLKIRPVKSGWTTIDKFANLEKDYDLKIKLVKSGWTTVQNFADIARVHNLNIGLVRSGWTTIQAFVGTAVTVGVSLAKRGWYTLSDWIGTVVSVYVDLVRSSTWLYGLSEWIGSSVEVRVNLKNGNYTSLAKFISGSNTPKISVGIDLYNASGYRSLRQFLGADKPIQVGISYNKSSSARPNGAQSNGVSAADIASRAMSAVSAAQPNGGAFEYDFGAGASYSNNGAESFPMPDNSREVALMETMLEVLRQIEAKETTVEVTANAVNSANRRLNQRAGLTIAPVGN